MTTETSREAREETVTDVRLAYSYRAIGDVVDHLGRTYRGALPEERPVLDELIQAAERMQQRMAALIQSRGPLEAE